MALTMTGWRAGSAVRKLIARAAHSVRRPRCLRREDSIEATFSEARPQQRFVVASVLLHVRGLKRLKKESRRATAVLDGVGEALSRLGLQPLDSSALARWRSKMGRWRASFRRIACRSKRLERPVSSPSSKHPGPAAAARVKLKQAPGLVSSFAGQAAGRNAVVVPRRAVRWLECELLNVTSPRLRLRSVSPAHPQLRCMRAELC